MYELIFIRRLLIALGGIVLCVIISRFGWNAFDSNRRFFGVALLILAFLVACGGQVIFLLSAYRWTWGWWL